MTIINTIILSLRALKATRDKKSIANSFLYDLFIYFTATAAT
jgi:hypothetical protein